MIQKFIPAPGKIVVMREKVSERLIKGLDLVRTEEMIEYESRANPWALVVGVGAPEVTQYGTTITTEIEPGDKVAVAQVGMTLPLETGDGDKDYIYVVPFDGVTGRIVAECPKCGHVERKGEEVMTLICPSCGDGKPDIAKIINASLPDIAEVNRSRG